MSSRLRTRFLLLTLVVLIVYWVWFGIRPRFAGSAQPFAERKSSLGGLESRVALALPNSYSTLLLADLETKPGAYSPGRNPFRYAAENRPASRPKIEGAEKKPPGRKPRRQEPKSSPNKLNSKKQLPKVDLTYLGSFGMKQQPIAVFRRGDDIINAFPGDVIGEGLIVGAIGYESVELKFADFPDEPAHRLASGG